MSFSKKGDEQKRRGYHHGNLRETLIQGALDLIAEKGPAGFTIADAARSAGVSPAAPYRHFRDRDDLMADVARRGFEELETRLSQAWNEGRPNPLSAFEQVGAAYLGFARDEPAYFAAMFEAGSTAAKTSELRQAGERAFTVLREASEAVCSMLPNEKRPPAMMMALHIWSFAHGIAALFGQGNRKIPIVPEELLEAAVLVYFRGLGMNDLDDDTEKE